MKNPFSFSRFFSRLGMLNPATLIMLAVLVFFVALLVWNSSQLVEPLVPTTPQAQITATLSGRITDTPYPKEWDTNYEQTNGIIAMGLALVLIIIGGTLGIIRRKS